MSIIRSIFTRETPYGLRATALVVIAIFLMILDKRMESFSAIRAAMTFSVVPIQYIVHWPAQMIDHLKGMMSAHDQLVNENLSLKSEQLLLRAELQRLMTIESENNYLKALVNSSRQLKRKCLIAEMLAVNSEPYIKQVVINKGAKDDVYVGQPVLDATGIMGQVTQVGLVTSRVTLINDPHSGVAVRNARNGIRTIVNGDSYKSKIRLMYLPKTVDVRQGDLFVTSGLGDRYPEGYPVGTVVSIANDPAQPFLEVYLQPSAHLDSSRQVLLIWYQKHA